MTTRALLCCFCFALAGCKAAATPAQDFTLDDAAATDDDASDDAGLDGPSCVSVGCPCATGSDCASKLCASKGGQLVCVACVPTNGGVEKCDGLDNNCNGKTDEGTCPDDGHCLVGVCDGASHNCHMTAAPEHSSCDDADACTLADECTSGVCAGAPATCDDGNPCTSADCSPATGCLNLPTSATCTDDNACTFADACSETTCVGTAKDCNDSNPCTDDTCANGACLSTANTATCDDGNGCTQGDVCANYACAGVPSCQDGDPCTDDSCQGNACVHDVKVGWQPPQCSQCAAGFSGTLCDACSDTTKDWPNCQ